jgi:hypothetical protein
VRRATAADVQTLVAMARDLHAESPNYRDEPYEPQVMHRWLAERVATTLLVDHNAIFLAEEGDQILGFLIAVIVPRQFNHLRIAAELMLYVRPHNRGGRALPAMADAYGAWAKAQGASKAMLGVSTGIHPERTVRAYLKRGATLDGYNVSFEL